MLDAATYLPTLEAAVAAQLGLPSEPPSEQLKAAALVVDLRIIRREVWSEVKLLAPSERAALDVAPPLEARERGIYHVLGAELGAVGAATPFVRCRIDHYYDKPVALNDVYTPRELSDVPELSHLDDALDEIAVGQPIPEALRCADLTPKTQTGDYRSAPMTKIPDFHGHTFGSALADAKAAVDGILRRGHPASGTIAVYAWPLLWLRYPTGIREIVLFYDPRGVMRAYIGFPGP